MKIYLVGQKGLPAVSGGVETHVNNLAVKLVELGHEVFAYTRHNYTDKKLKEYMGVKLISLPSIPGKNFDAISHTFFACLDFIFKSRKADIIHFHSIGPASLIWMIKLFRPRVKVVFTFHSQCYFNTKWGKFAKFYLSIGERIGCKMADEVIVISKNLKKYVEEKYSRDIIYIPNGVNTLDPLPVNSIKERWELKKGSYILSVGRLVRNKGIEYLIEAYKNINTDKKLVITGDGDFQDELMKLADNHKNIIFTGNQTGQVLEELYSNAAIFVQPSEAEGLSIALLEAISYKLPIIISDIPANKEVADDNAIVFKNKNSKDLELKLDSFLQDINNPAIDKNVKVLYNKIISQYNWNDIAIQTVNIYKKVL